MKVAVATVAFKEERFIEDCIKQFQPFNLFHLVLLSEVSWARNTETDRTGELAENLGASTISADWETEAEQRNLGQQFLKDFDWILIVDADERYEKEDVERWLKFLETADKPAYGMGRIITYWQDWNHKVDPEERPGLITSVRPTVRFTHARGIDSDWANLPSDVTCHHGSYIRTDEEMLRKINNFEHRVEMVPNWYEEKWLGWKKDNSIEDLHPVTPTGFKRIITV